MLHKLFTPPVENNETIITAELKLDRVNLVEDCRLIMRELTLQAYQVKQAEPKDQPLLTKYSAMLATLFLQCQKYPGSEVTVRILVRPERYDFVYEGCDDRFVKGMYDAKLLTPEELKDAQHFLNTYDKEEGSHTLN